MIPRPNEYKKKTNKFKSILKQQNQCNTADLKKVINYIQALGTLVGKHILFSDL